MKSVPRSTTRCGQVKGIALLVFLSLAPAVYSQAPFVELRIAPEGAFALGATAANYSTAVGGVLTTGLGLASLGGLTPQIEAAYSHIPLAADASLAMIRAGVGAQFQTFLSDRLGLFALANAGGYYGMLQGALPQTGYGFAFRGAGGVQLFLSDTLSIVAGAGYNSAPGLYSGVSAFVGTAYRFGGGFSDGGSTRGSRQSPRPELLEGEANWTDAGDLRIGYLDLQRMFPVLFKYYDQNPLGSFIIQNTSRQAIRNLEIRFDAERIIDNPKLSERISELNPGEQVDVDLYALFNDQVLTITEGTRIAASIDLKYQIGNTSHEERVTVTLSTYDRNSLRWDDDTKIAAFVTAKDEEIQRLGKNMAALSRSAGIEAIAPELQLGMAQFALMEELGLAYVIDPSSAYAELSSNASAVDYVQFPRQTLEYLAGDCDDLSATYNALLESVGVNTAFITIPGHIYSAFRLNMNADAARDTFSNTADLIFQEDGSVWVPVEVTVLNRGFMEAWSTGARQWREHNPSGTAALFRTGDAWAFYEPVAFSVSDARLPSPDQGAVQTIFQRELNKYVGLQIFSDEREILERLAENPDNLRLMNRLGVLYARHGKVKEAREQFQKVVERAEFAPAIVNLANLAYLSGEFSEASNLYARALVVDPYDTIAVLGQARASHALEDYGTAETNYRVLASLDPELAAEFSYLDPSSSLDATGRASNAALVQSKVVWEDEE